jgi:hypothetical protein
MTPEQLTIMQHSLGLDQYGRGRAYRNHYCAGGRDAELCRDLVTLGYMTEHKPSQLTGGDPLFTVTASGKDYVRNGSPMPPPIKKQTRSQKRYREFLACDTGFKFGEFLRMKARRA